MSAVDVLAVMDRLGKEWRDESVIVGRLDSADAIDSVFAAVAELIEAASSGIPMGTSHVKPQESLHFLPQQAARLRNALSRVRGAE